MGNAHQKPGTENADAAHLGVAQKLTASNGHTNLSAFSFSTIDEIVNGRFTRRTIYRWRDGTRQPPDWIVAALAERVSAELAEKTTLAMQLHNAPRRVKFVPSGPKPKNVRAGPVEPAPLAKG